MLATIASEYSLVAAILGLFAAGAWYKAATGPVPLAVPTMYWDVGSRPEDLERGHRMQAAANWNKRASLLTACTVLFATIAWFAQFLATFSSF
jgi:hypothetical protein